MNSRTTTRCSAWTRAPRPTRSKRPFASWRANTTPMSAKSLMRAAHGAAQQEPIRCCRTLRTTAYDTLSAQAAAQGARGGGGDFQPPHWDAGFAFSEAQWPLRWRRQRAAQRLLRAALWPGRTGAAQAGRPGGWRAAWGRPARPHRTGHYGRLPWRHAHHPPAHGAYLDAGGHVVPEQRSPGSKDPQRYARRPADPSGRPGQSGAGRRPCG